MTQTIDTISAFKRPTDRYTLVCHMSDGDGEYRLYDETPGPLLAWFCALPLNTTTGHRTGQPAGDALGERFVEGFGPVDAATLTAAIPSAGNHRYYAISDWTARGGWDGEGRLAQR